MMPRFLPATCARCGLLFTVRSPGRVDPTESGKLPPFVMEGNTTNCPQCGGVAAIADVTVDQSGNMRIDLVLAREAYRALRDVAKAGGDLRAIVAELTDAQHRGASSDQVTATAARHSPALGLVFGLAFERKFSVGDVIATIALIVSLWQLARNEPDEQTIINNIIHQQTIVQSVAPAPTARRHPRPIKPVASHTALKGHHPCPCGSGRRYRDCHRGKELSDDPKPQEK